MRTFTFLLFFTLIAGCIDVEKKEATFYAVESLVDDQIEELRASKAVLIKKGQMDGELSESTSIPDSAQWERELGIFRQLDINKPRLLDLYESTTETDAQGNALTIYRSLTPDETRVNWLEIQENNGIRSLKAEVDDSNPVYSSVRVMGMQFSEDSRHVLESYYMYGGEQLTTKDSIHYRIDAEVRRN